MNSTEKMVLELHAAGKSIPDIAARIGRTESTVYMYLSRHGLNPSKSRKNGNWVSAPGELSRLAIRLVSVAESASKA